MKLFCKIKQLFKTTFARSYYRCTECGLTSDIPDDLCSPVEVEFKE